MIRRTLLLLAIFLAFATTATARPLQVFVSIAPQKYIVDRLAGGLAEVHMLVDRGQDPHTFEPSPRQLLLLDTAQIYFTVGLEFERLLVGRMLSLNPQLKIVALDQGIAKLPMTEEEPGEAHQAEGDPHIWMSPLLVKKMANTAADALAEMDPTHRDDYQRNLALLRRDLEQANHRIGEQLVPYKGRAFFVFHPAFTYFADTYGLVQKAVESGGRAPSARQLAAIIGEAKEEKVRIVFVQPQFDEKSAAAIATAIGGAVIPLDSLAYDLIGNFRHIAKALEDAFSGQATTGSP